MEFQELLGGNVLFPEIERYVDVVLVIDASKIINLG